MRMLTCGAHALLVECDRDAHVLPLARAVRAAIEQGDLIEVEEIVPAARTLLLRCRAVADVAAVAAAVRRLEPIGTDDDRRPGNPGDDEDGELVTIDVVYDGADLDDVAAQTGRTPAAVVRIHTEVVWTVAFCGFAPGFGYLRAPDDPLTVARRRSPRTRVPNGSVGLAGPYSGVYPTSSPGGWQLIGHTDAVLWDVARPSPALLVPGTRVRFRSIG